VNDEPCRAERYNPADDFSSSRSEQPLEEINAQLQRQKYFQSFPPPGIEIVSWYVMMGIGQVVTLRVPASRLRDVNLAIEKCAWGAFRTEFYPTYDYKSIAEQQRKQSP